MATKLKQFANTLASGAITLALCMPASAQGLGLGGGKNSGLGGLGGSLGGVSDTVGGVTGGLGLGSKSGGLNVGGPTASV